MHELKVIVDNRERNIELIEGLSERGVRVSFSQLPVGDYIVSDRLCIERKTIRDFGSSIINSRLFDQAKRLSESFKKPILIIEGDDLDFMLSPNVLLGAITSLYVDYNIQILRSKDVEETTALITKIAEMEQGDEKREPKIIGNKKAYTKSQWQLLILGSMPGIGPKLAKHLLNHFNTIKEVVNASIEELKEVDKIGDKKAKRIHEILNEKFEEELL